jgi:hypothetical protein
LRAREDPSTDPGGDPHEPPIKPPRGDGAGGAGAGNGGGRGSPPSTVPGTVSETGNPIPIVYGTVRLGLQVLERYPYSVGAQTNVWLANHAYNVGDVVIANGNVYTCTAQGTSFPSTFTLASATVSNGGNGYAVNDTIDLALGVMTTRAQLKVTGQSAGHVTAISVNAAGVGYTRLPPSPDGQDSTSGGGSGATFSLVWNSGGGPFGQGDNITGGNGSLRWKFLYPATVAAAQAAQWVPSTAYAVGAVVGSVGNLYYCFTAGTSSASGSLGNGPSGQSTDITDGTVHWSYIQPGYVIPCVFGICEGPIYGVSGAWQDNFAELPSITSLPHPGTQIQLDLGTSGGWTRPAWIPTPDPTLADLYPNTALLSMVFLSNGGDGSLPNVSLEVAGIFCDATHSDVSAADIATDILTHSRRGVAWPSARVDSVSTGAGASSWRTYCTAYGLNLSFLLDSQTAPLQILGNLLLATNTDAVWTNRADGLGGMLKFVPRCDTSLTANGVTFTPPGLANVPGQYGTGQLGPDDVLEIPKSTRRSPTDCLNSFPIEFVDRTQDYRLSTVDDPDMADVDQRGLMRASTTTLSGIVLQPQSAVMLSRIFAQRSLKVRNTWTLKLSFRHMLLEPTDVITYRDDVIGRTTTLRVIAADEQNMDGSITFTCEEWSSAGIHVAAQVTPQGQSTATYKPAQGTDVGTFVAGPQAVPAATLPSSSLLRATFINQWPNGGSENPPPPGAAVPNDGTNPEFDFMFNAGLGNAYSGSYVRQLLLTAPGTKTLRFRVPVNVGDQVPALSVQYRMPNTGGTPTFKITGSTLDASLNNTGGVINNLTGTGTWTQFRSDTGQAFISSGTSYYEFAMSVTTIAAGTAELWLDQIVVYLPIDGDLGIAARTITGNGLASQAAWTAPALLSGWANFGAGWQPAGYYKDFFGAVHLRGVVTNAAGNAGGVANLMFTLPLAHRPANRTPFAVLDMNGTTVRFDIDTFGQALWNAAVPAGALYSLNGLEYDTR